MNRFLIKLNRFSGWVLLILMILFVVSGYGQTKGIIDPVLAKYLHEQLLVIPFFIFLVLHVGISMRYALIRWKIFKTSKSANIFSIIFGVILLIFLFWLFFI